jgi:hypothetical protein
MAIWELIMEILSHVAVMPPIEMLMQFRKGPFMEASQDEKNAWFFYCSEIMTIVSPEWTRVITTEGHLFSDKVTCSDEAFALWALSLNVKEWCNETSLHNNRTMAGERGIEVPNGKKRKIGNHQSLHEMELYNRLFTTVQLKRRSNDAPSWDLGFQLYWKQQRDAANSAKALIKQMRPEIPMDDWELMPYPASWKRAEI